MGTHLSNQGVFVAQGKMPLVTVLQTVSKHEAVCFGQY